MRPLYIAGQAGLLFLLFYAPAGRPAKRAIIHIPAFAEEMNKSRRMVALQARALAEQGCAVVILDLFGTGDSTGDFGEATWQIWLQDIGTSIEWLKQQGIQAIDLWGLRSGTLLAMDFAHHNPDKIDHLLCWQPVLNGETFIMQFLRLRVAAAMMYSKVPQEKTSDLKQQLLEGYAIEVAGYLLNPDLMKPLMALRTEQMHLQNLKGIAIFEIVANEANAVAMANAHFFGKLQEQGINVSLTKVSDDVFWTTQEISVAPNLINLTSEKVESWL